MNNFIGVLTNCITNEDEEINKKLKKMHITLIQSYSHHF